MNTPDPDWADTEWPFLNDEADTEEEAEDDESEIWAELRERDQYLEYAKVLAAEVLDTLSDATGLTQEQQMVGDIPNPDAQVVFSVAQLYALTEKCRSTRAQIHFAQGGTFTITETARCGDPDSIMPTDLLPEAERILREASEGDDAEGGAV